MRNYLNSGSSLSQTAPYDVASGAGFQVGTMFCVAKAGALSGATVVCFTRGQFDLTKATGQAWTPGLAVYWDNTAKNVTSTSTSNKLIGWATQGQASGDTIGRVFVTGQA